jgi:glycerophosphoryl diester phosphodiesterase
MERNRFRSTNGPLGIAHRGASRLAPENTLAAIHRAIEDGAPAIECDVHRTKDNHLVVIHDASVDRTTNGRGAVADLTVTEIRSLDAGAWFGPEFVGERIPLLDEVFTAVEGRALLQIELKQAPTISPGIEPQVVDVLRRRGMEDDVAIISFDHVSIRTVRSLSDRIATGILVYGRLADGPTAALAVGADALCVDWTYASEDVIAGAHGAGLGCFVWTVDDEAAMRRFREQGVDGITSDDTCLLGQVIGWR